MLTRLVASTLFVRSLALCSQYLDNQLKDPVALSSLQEDERLLSGILRILVKCNGKLRSDPSGNPNDPDSPEVQLVTLLRESDYRRRGCVIASLLCAAAAD